jgi:prepilin-type N-terminal cleavage/methylation domain-containing protein/prepilin-type processing-associated H-X9-DG protein
MVRFVREVPRAAFTLTELLVVIALVAILLGLLLPAVQKVREAASRMQCSNHLKQMGLAFHSHHDILGKFPHGGTNDPGLSHARPDLRSQWSWCYQILPFMEQNGLHQETSVKVIDTTAVKIFYCPARRAPQLYDGLSKVDYAGCAGSDARDGSDGVVRRPPTQLPTRIADITDGTSNTIMLGEKQLNAALFGQSSDDNETCFRPGWNGDFQVYRIGREPPSQDTREPCDGSPSHRFGSAHPNGLNIVFADGSVRHVRYSVNPTVWLRACIRNDGEVFNQSNL